MIWPVLCEDLAELIALASILDPVARHQGAVLLTERSKIQRKTTAVDLRLRYLTHPFLLAHLASIHAAVIAKEPKANSPIRLESILKTQVRVSVRCCALALRLSKACWIVVALCAHR